MAEFIAKLGLDAKEFVSGMEAAAQKTGGVSSGLASVAAEANKAGQAMQQAGNNGGLFDNLKSKVSSLGASFGSLGSSALSIFGGGALVAGLGGIGAAFGEILNGAREADDAADSLAISLAKAGLSGAELEAEQKRLGAVAKQTANDFAIPTTEVAKLQAKITGFSGATGDQLDELTQFSLGAANALQMPAESVAKLLGKAADPEGTAKLKSLGIQFDKNATAAEKMEIIQRKLGPSIQATKDSTQDAIGTFDRISNSIKEFTITLASGLFDVIGQILNALSPFVTAFQSAFSGMGGGLDGFLSSLKSTVADVVSFISPVINFLADKVAGGLLLAFTIVKTQVGIAFNVVKSIFTSIYDAIRPLIDQFTGLGASTFSFSNVVKQIVPIIEDFGGVMGQLGKIVVDIVLVPMKMIFQVFASGIGFVRSLFSSTNELTGATEKSGEAADKSGGFFQRVHEIMVGLQGVLGGVSSAFRFLTAQVGQLFQAITTLNFGRIKDIITETIAGTSTAFDKGYNDAIQANSKILAAAKGLEEEVVKLGAEKDKNVKAQLKKSIEERQSALSKQLEEERKAYKISVADAQAARTIIDNLFAGAKGRNASAAADAQGAAADAEDAAEKADKASKQLVDTKQKELQLAVANLVVEQQKTENAIKQQAIDENRNLTDKERETILRSQLKLNNDIEQATRRVMEVTGQGADIQIGLELTAGVRDDLKLKLLGDLGRLSEEKIKIGSDLVKLSDEQKKELSEAIKKAAADIKDDVKDALTFKTFIENPLDAFGQITSAIQQLRDKANEAAAIGDAKLNETLLSQAEDLQSKLDGLLKDQKTKQAEEDKKKAAETAQAQAQRRSDIEKLFIRKIEEEKIASNKRVAENTEMLNALKKEEDALTASLKNRELSYEEFSAKLVDIEARRAAAQATIQEEQTSAFSQTMNGALAATNEVLASELAKMSAGFDAEFTKQAEAGTVSLETLGSAAAAQFGAMVISGQSAGNALKDVSANVVGKLIDMYVAPVILSTLSFLGPFALPVAIALVASAKSLFASAVAGFQDGGYTGDGGPSQIAGVVHGQEFVHTADVTRKHRGLFEHLHKGGELSSWMVTTAGALQAPAVAAPQLNTYGIESRLDRLEMAINRGNRKFESMRAVQMTVEHDPTLTIKAQSRNLEIRSARS